MGLTEAANFSKCPAIAIDANENEKGPKCVDDSCRRRCNESYQAMKPTQVTCEKEDGEFAWNKTLGACKKCKDFEGLDASLTPNCKTNSSKIVDVNSMDNRL